MRAALRAAAGVVIAAAGCAGTSGADWVQGGDEPEVPRSGAGWVKAAPGDLRCAGPGDPRCEGGRAATSLGSDQDEDGAAGDADAAGDGAIVLREHGRPRAGAAPQEAGADLYRNTYYDFPRDGGGDTATTIYDAACAPIARVSRGFHDAACVQGSGRLVSGETVSFARRDCACAEVCPRTAQRICFERLDPARFPYGRGATGRAITPLRTVAVDTDVIPLGTRLFVPELAGLPLPDGGRHDGCFVAEDRGIKVVGRQIDVFTGDPAMTARWNALFPSNRGVRVVLRDPRCGRGPS